MADWSALYLRRDLATTPTVAALGYGGFSLGMLTGRLSGDHLRRHLSPYILIATGTILASAALTATLVIPTPTAAIAGDTLVGVGLSLVAPLVFAAAGNQPDQPATDALAGVATLGYAGFLSGPPMIGLLAHTNGLRTGLALVAALALAAAAAARHAQSLHTRQPPTPSDPAGPSI